MDLTKRELENRLNAPINATSSKEQQRLKSEQNNSLQEFVNMASGLVTRLRTDTDNAQSAFKVNLTLNFHCTVRTVNNVVAVCVLQYQLNNTHMGIALPYFERKQTKFVTELHTNG